MNNKSTLRNEDFNRGTSDIEKLSCILKADPATHSRNYHVRHEERIQGFIFNKLGSYSSVIHELFGGNEGSNCMTAHLFVETLINLFFIKQQFCHTVIHPSNY